MRCSVSMCKNCNGNKASDISFFKFPPNEKLLKQWVNFCRRGNNFKPKNRYICMDHFKSSDFENNLKYEMGFSKKRSLRRGAIPTIYKASDNKSASNEEHNERMREKLENEKIVEALLQKYNDSNATCEQIILDNDTLKASSIPNEVPSASKQLFVYRILYNLTMQLIQNNAIS